MKTTYEFSFLTSARIPRLDNKIGQEFLLSYLNSEPNPSFIFRFKPLALLDSRHQNERRYASRGEDESSILPTLPRSDLKENPSVPVGETTIAHRTNEKKKMHLLTVSSSESDDRYSRVSNTPLNLTKYGVSNEINRGYLYQTKTLGMRVLPDRFLAFLLAGQMSNAASKKRQKESDISRTRWLSDHKQKRTDSTQVTMLKVDGKKNRDVMNGLLDAWDIPWARREDIIKETKKLLDAYIADEKIEQPDGLMMIPLFMAMSRTSEGMLSEDHIQTATPSNIQAVRHAENWLLDLSLESRSGVMAQGYHYSITEDTEGMLNRRLLVVDDPKNEALLHYSLEFSNKEDAFGTTMTGYQDVQSYDNEAIIPTLLTMSIEEDVYGINLGNNLESVEKGEIFSIQQFTHELFNPRETTRTSSIYDLQEVANKSSSTGESIRSDHVILLTKDETYFQGKPLETSRLFIKDASFYTTEILDYYQSFSVLEESTSIIRDVTYAILDEMRFMEARHYDHPQLGHTIDRRGYVTEDLITYDILMTPSILHHPRIYSEINSSETAIMKNEILYDVMGTDTSIIRSFFGDRSTTGQAKITDINVYTDVYKDREFMVSRPTYSDKERIEARPIHEIISIDKMEKESIQRHRDLSEWVNRSRVLESVIRSDSQMFDLAPLDASKEVLSKWVSQISQEGDPMVVTLHGSVLSKEGGSFDGVALSDTLDKDGLLKNPLIKGISFDKDGEIQDYIQYTSGLNSEAIVRRRLVSVDDLDLNARISVNPILVENAMSKEARASEEKIYTSLIDGDAIVVRDQRLLDDKTDKEIAISRSSLFLEKLSEDARITSNNEIFIEKLQNGAFQGDDGIIRVNKISLDGRDDYQKVRLEKISSDGKSIFQDMRLEKISSDGKSIFQFSYQDHISEDAKLIDPLIISDKAKKATSIIHEQIYFDPKQRDTMSLIDMVYVIKDDKSATENISITQTSSVQDDSYLLHHDILSFERDKKESTVNYTMMADNISPGDSLIIFQRNMGKSTFKNKEKETTLLGRVTDMIMAVDQREKPSIITDPYSFSFENKKSGIFLDTKKIANETDKESHIHDFFLSEKEKLGGQDVYVKLSNKPEYDPGLIERLTIGETYGDDLGIIQQLMNIQRTPNQEAVVTRKQRLSRDQSDWQEIWDRYSAGVDVLDPPDSDFDYSKLADKVYDLKTGVPHRPLSKTNKAEVKVGTPLHHPLPEHFDLGIDDTKVLAVDNYVIIEVILALESLKFRNKLRYAGMPAAKTVQEMFSNLYVWIQNGFPDDKEFQRMFRFARWYAEHALIKSSTHILHREYSSFLSKIHEFGDLGIPYTASGWIYRPNAMVISTTDTDCLLSFNHENYIDGKVILRGYFDNPLNQGTMKVLVDGEEVSELTSSYNGAFELTFDNPQGDHLYELHFVGESGRISLSSVDISGCVFENAWTESDESDSNGLKIAQQLINMLLRYYELHHEGGKSKGSMEVNQRKVWNTQ